MEFGVWVFGIWVFMVVGLLAVGGITVVQAVRSKIKIEKRFRVIEEKTFGVLETPKVCRANYLISHFSAKKATYLPSFTS